MRFEEFRVFAGAVRNVLLSRPFQEYVLEHELDEDEAVIQAEAYVLETTGNDNRLENEQQGIRQRRPPR